MGCEFSNKLRSGLDTEKIIKEVYDQLNEHDQKMFKIHYGSLDSINENEAYRIFYHCKRILKRYNRDKK